MDSECPRGPQFRGHRTPRLLGIPVSAMTSDQFLGWLAQSCRRHRPGQPPAAAMYLNAHTANLSRKDPDFRTCLLKADVVYADGMSIVRACRRLGSPLPERVNAGDFLSRFAWMCVARGLKMGLLGSQPGVADCAARTLEARIPGLVIPFRHHGHFELGSEEESAMLRQVRSCHLDILLVGMGSPRQERWAIDKGPDTGARVIWCVGALFEYFSGSRRRAPVWMRRAGLEWLFRLAMEPRRLAGRYLLGNARFLWEVRKEAARAADTRSKPADSD